MKEIGKRINAKAKVMKYFQMETFMMETMKTESHMEMELTGGLIMKVMKGSGIRV